MNRNVLKEQVEQASFCLEKHKVVCFPTETVMGLGVVFDSEEAYNLLNKVKCRPEDKPYTLMCKDIKTLNFYGNINQKLNKVVKTFMPGSLTIIVEAKPGIPTYVTHGLPYVGLRVPTNIEALELLKKINKPLLVPSANKSGQKPCLTSVEAREIFKDEVAAYIDGEAKKELPSTIVDFSKDEPILLRQGPISFEDILRVYNED